MAQAKSQHIYSAIFMSNIIIAYGLNQTETCWPTAPSRRGVDVFMTKAVAQQYHASQYQGETIDHFIL